MTEHAERADKEAVDMDKIVALAQEVQANGYILAIRRGKDKPWVHLHANRWDEIVALGAVIGELEQSPMGSFRIALLETDSLYVQVVEHLP